ncbi:M50 family metallopeptidase [Halobacillus sp. B23F22_1]|uniref:M50 family metallopeptidase n=1 Tax=Halobacillus sp. B23F22_1 TaxID=3459514 RepID=UPI00373EFB55
MKLQIIISLILAFLLTQAPLIGKYFAMLNTMIHETGHSLVALLTGGEVRNISLFPNTSGVTMTGHSSWLSQLLTSLSGYVFASFVGYFFFYLIIKGHYRWMVYILMALLLINVLFWVRNIYGIFWLVTFGAGFIWLLRTGHQTVIQYVLVFIACLVMVEAVSSAFEIMLLSLFSPSQAGDAANLARIVPFVPAPIFGFMFFGQAAYFFWLAFRRVFLI